MAFRDFNSDVLFEIMSRTDLNTMRKCRILSRECNALTYESSFMQSHKDNTRTICGYLILSCSRLYSSFLDIDDSSADDSKLRFDFLDARSVQILAVVDIGLAFCKSQHPKNRHYVCKPTTQQWELIPSPNPEYFAKKIDMIVLRSNPLWFKIVRLSYRTNEFCDYIHKPIHCEIFDSYIWAWKQTVDLMLSYYEYFNLDYAISASGGLHWVTHIRNKSKVLSFHPDQENWTSIPMPESCNGYNHYSIYLTVHEGKLAILSSRRDIELVEVWIMKDRNGGKCWDKKFSIDLEGIKKDRFRAVSFYNADTLLMLNYSKAIFYDFKKGRSHPLDLCGKHMYLSTYPSFRRMMSRFS